MKTRGFREPPTPMSPEDLAHIPPPRGEDLFCSCGQWVLDHPKRCLPDRIEAMVIKPLGTP